VRVALQALAAALGGTQSLHTNSMDEALSLPSERAATVALRTQQIIAHETGIADVVDPLGGSHLVEELTDRLAEQARALIARIDEMGGMVAAIERGWPQKEIHEAAYRAQLAVESRDQILVGVNTFHSPDEARPPLSRLSREVEARQKARLREFRAGRDAAAVERALGALERVARGSDNLVPAILDAVRAQGTVGEIADTMRRVFGEHREAEA
jgi:methylmalonyl-CoA mutase N-terminal domain/subunit